MKNIKIFNLKSLTLILTMVLMTTSCSNWIDQDINNDPDNPSDVPMNLILPGIQQNMGYNLLGNNSVRTNNIWMQQFDGTDRQSFTEARYQLTSADVENLWTSIYAEMLINSEIMIDKANSSGSPNFAGVGQVLQATTLGITTDLFGDIPFSQALNGSDNVLTPEYDSQQVIYETIFTTLNQAVANLNNTENVFEVDGDVIYGGNIDNWKKAAYSVEARHALQLSKQNGNAAYTQALAAVSNGFSSNVDDFLVPWEDANHNPIFQFMEQRGDIRMGATMVNMMLSNDDPRLPFYAEVDGNGNYTGSEAGTENTDASLPGTYIAGETASTRLMTYSELKFIEAECRLMLSQGDAQAAYEEAVAASVLRVTEDDNTAWLDANINGVPVTLEGIILQKYIDGFGTNQPYADFRRTGFPSLSIATGAVLSDIPTRFPYAQSELDYNSGNVPALTISDKVWWDQ